MKIFLLGTVDPITYEDEEQYRQAAERLRAKGHEVSYFRDTMFLISRSQDEDWQNAISENEKRKTNLLFHCKYISEFDLVLLLNSFPTSDIEIFVLWFIRLNKIQTKWLFDYEKEC